MKGDMAHISMETLRYPARLCLEINSKSSSSQGQCTSFNAIISIISIISIDLNDIRDNIDTKRDQPRQPRKGWER